MKQSEIKGFGLIVYYLSIFLVIIGLIILLPLMALPFYPEEVNEAKNFIIPGVLSVFVGYFIHRLVKNNPKGQLEKQQDAVLVVLVWILAIFVSSIPFLLTGEYNIVQSLFEVTSGYSTTGLSVVDVSSTPHVYLLYRSLLLFFGGLGLVLIFTSAISDKYGMRLYYAEGHNDKLVPNLIRSARLILSIYSGYIVFGTILYIVFGMPVFDAINHSIASVSTGGFSTQLDSIGHYQSFAIEMITIVLMMLGGTNFLIHVLLLKRKFKLVLKHVEIKLFLIFMILFIPLLVVSILQVEGMTFFAALRVSLFQFVSSLTTTGFQTVSTFHILPHSFLTIIILLMLVGGGLGSTAGGIKQYRIALLFKSMYWNFKERISHKRVVRTHFINRSGTDEVVQDKELSYNHVFLAVYFCLFVVGVFIYTLYGYNIQDSMFEYASAMGTVGLSIGIIGYSAPSGILIITMIGMFLGRLEFFIVLIAIAQIWRRSLKKV